MGRLDDYRAALTVVRPQAQAAELVRALETGGPRFATFIVDHGLGPLWHARTGREEFRDSRRVAEALYLAQAHALQEIDALFERAGIEHAVIKGGANRLLLYDDPALRACHDLDLLVRPDDRVRAAAVLSAAGFRAVLEARAISRALMLCRGPINIDLHWGLLREGRLRRDPADEMVTRRRRVGGLWMPDAEHALFTLLVHPAFAKHLSGWDMGMHRVADILAWLRTQPCEREALHARLAQDGVRTAAWATLRWTQMLAPPEPPAGLETLMAGLQPGALRRSWLEAWLEHDLSTRTAGMHWLRLLGFSPFLHDTLRDSARALAGRSRARQRSAADLEAFAALQGPARDPHHNPG